MQGAYGKKAQFLGQSQRVRFAILDLTKNRLKNDSTHYDINTALPHYFHYLSTLPSLFTKSNRFYLLFFVYP